MADLSGSAQVLRAFERTHCHLHIFRLHFEAVRPAQRRRWPSTAGSPDALVAGDAAAAEAAMRAHLEAACYERLRPVSEEAGGPTQG